MLILVVALVFSREEKAEVYDMNLVMGEARNVFWQNQKSKAKNQNEGASGGFEEESGELVGDVERASVAGEMDESVVTVVEFGDFECPACRGWSEKVRDLVGQYDGRVRLVYRHMPLESIHERAKAAAEAAEAAAAFGKFWEYQDLLYGRQGEWSESGDLNGLLVSYAVELDIDGREFVEEIEGRAVVRVEQDITDARSLGIDATPTFFVEGEKVKGEDLAAVIEDKF